MFCVIAKEYGHGIINMCQAQAKTDSSMASVHDYSFGLDCETTLN
jgi:hypothetical protein